MSTQGIFILKKNGVERGIRISHDAYPSSAGQDIVDLIKTTDLSVLYDLMTEYDETDIPEDDDEACPEEPRAFSYDMCRLAVKNNTRLRISPTAPEQIKNSLFCEYAYVADLDQQWLFFYIGLQTKPQKGNPYGTEPIRSGYSDKEYYPCRQARGFTFEYIRNAGVETVIETMQRQRFGDPRDIRYYTVDDLAGTAASEDKREEKLAVMALNLSNLAYRLLKLKAELSVLHPQCDNRVRELSKDYLALQEAVTALEKRIEIIR